MRHRFTSPNSCQLNGSIAAIITKRAKMRKPKCQNACQIAAKPQILPLCNILYGKCLTISTSFCKKFNTKMKKVLDIWGVWAYILK
jgi:hypothetical protein